MRLVCPECAATYDVPEAALAAGRRLRCSSCATSWEWSPPTPQAADRLDPPPPEPPTPAPPPRIEALAGNRMAPPQDALTPRRGTALAWAASVVVIAGVVAALYVWRAPVMHAWPPATRLYAALGIA